MITAKTLKSIEYDKILSSVANYAVLNKTKERIIDFNPVSELSEAEFLLNKTLEAYKLLYTYSIGGIFYVDDVTDQLERVDRGGTLNNGELLRVASNLKSARMLKHSFSSVNDESIKILFDTVSVIYVNQELEKEIFSKIISENEVSDNASPRLASIRREIKNLNVKIREQLNSYMRGSFSKYLQENVITLRQDRYVIPVKSEYRSFVKGFIHDQSGTGATVFIEPEMVMELNNELKRASFDEQNEIQRILRELTSKVATISGAIKSNFEILITVDECFARAGYSFYNKCSYPILNDKGFINIKRGKHPLIDKDKVVPVSISLGKDYRYLLITGPNTGGKTVSLKLVGLLSLMAMSGLFIPADDESDISVFDGIYCDIGDEQSIEQSLSTFSSHIKNIINVINNSNEKSLILLDEIGAGTDPEEGSALALAIINELLKKNSCGIVTTHYSKLKEFAATNKKIQNASMEFDSSTLKPLYKLNIGIPGSSNAIDIAKTLGLNENIITEALSYMSDDKIGFEEILKKAEDERRKYNILNEEAYKINQNKEIELKTIQEEKDKIIKEREKIYATAKAETKKIVADKLLEAEEIIDELKSILKKAGLESREVFRASELKNRIKNSKYLQIENDTPFELINSKIDNLKAGDKVYSKSLGTYVTVNNVRKSKNELEVLVGNIRTTIKFNDAFNTEVNQEKSNDIKVNKRAVLGLPVTEINVIGKTSLEAINKLTNFIAQAVMHGLEEIKVIHGVGQGILLKEVRNYLKKDKNVKEFRRGKYGEGENGVTIITLK